MTFDKLIRYQNTSGSRTKSGLIHRISLGCAKDIVAGTRIRKNMNLKCINTQTIYDRMRAKIKYEGERRYLLHCTKIIIPENNAVDRE